jgi:hypothetical protein
MIGIPLELYPESVFFGRYWSVFLCIHHTNTEGKLGQYLSKIWREPLKTMAGAPFFLRKGGPGPLFVHFALLLKKKKEFQQNFSKKEFPRNLKKVFPPKLTEQQNRPKIPKAQQI